MKKTIIFLAVSLVIFSVALKASAEESFYANLKINEVKVGEKINFSLESASAEYGEYDNFYDIYREDSPDDYILETYNGNKESTAKYSLSSSRFTFWDGQTESGEPTGGINESDSGVISIYIPYDRAKPTAFIKIDNKGVKTDFIALPVSRLEEEFKKIPLCKKENETGNLNENRCCAGLMPKLTENSNFVCVNCGNGICEKNEDAEFCFEDCSVEAIQANKTSGSGKSNLFLATIIISIIAVLLLMMLAFKAFKSMKNRE